jgi:hypothetical protein
VNFLEDQGRLRIAVSGSRSWTDVEAIVSVLTPLLWPEGRVVLLDGGARGPDTEAHEFWRLNGGRFERFPVTSREWRTCDPSCDHGARRRRQNPRTGEWYEYCQAAGMRRNRRMMQSRPDGLIAFWDGKSNGTHNMILLAEEFGVPAEVFTPDRVMLLRQVSG